MRGHAWALAWAGACAWGAVSCADVSLRSPVEHGRALFEDPTVSPSPLNRFACATCHDAELLESDTKRNPGAVLAGVDQRATYWGGQESDLLRAIDHCLNYFMAAPVPLARDAPEAEALYAFLTSLEPAASDEQPFSVVVDIEDVPPGDSDAGEQLFRGACAGCHGSAHQGEGRLTEFAPVLPEDTLNEHDFLDSADLRLVFIEKVRHGGFFGYGGNMPLFSLEALSDEELSDILEFLSVPVE